MKNLIKISITSLGILTILSSVVLAATGVVNAPSGLVLREEASKTANPVATIEDKTKVEIIEKTGEWYKAKYNSQEGYLFAEYVNVEEQIDDTTEIPNKQDTTISDDSIQAASSLKVYNIPLITSTVINTINAEAEITIIKEITNWSYVSTGDVQGWVRTYGIKGNTVTDVPETPVETPETPTEEPSEPTVSEPEEDKPTYDTPSNSEQTEVNSTATKGFVAVDTATVRKQATTNSEVVTYLTKDTSFTIKAETEEWYKIEYTGLDGTVYAGYIYKQLVTI